MYFSYTAGSEAVRSTEHLVVLCHGHDRVLVPLPATYEDVIRLARAEFRLADEHELRLFTRDLSGSVERQDVRITAQAWLIIRHVLPAIYVEIFNPAAAPSAGRTSMAPAQVVTHEMGAVLPSSVVPAAMRRLSRMSLGVPKLASPSASISRTSISHHKSGSDDDDEGRMPFIDDEAEEEVRIGSKGKRNIERSRVLSDAEEEDEADGDEEEQQVEAEDDARMEEDEDELMGSVREEESTRATPPQKQLEEEIGNRSLPSSASKPPYSAREPRRSSMAHQRSSPRQSNLTPIKVKQENLSTSTTPSRSKPKSESNPPAATPRKSEAKPENDRLLVTVHLPSAPGGDDTMLFKTRGRHPVSKVLLQACRTFKIEDMYKRARLVMIMEADDQHGGYVEHHIPCAPDDTMARAGAQEDSFFIIEIDGKAEEG
ncbi:hypothetical protein WOLCODRAFT_166401 [Wolfiporia cocos MD-104 SS10]|uniref:Uncharacterized protein n=1 Tax=Wolfiporia cocos (strain MD-104) TaxID=742152 RepID=A0A2H3JG32_WOLCO|nr:hypothetical protein WOLCODRAFT_166401 [Wolfiporia cocos MD-104 SS10]